MDTKAVIPGRNPLLNTSFYHNKQIFEALRSRSKQKCRTITYESVTSFVPLENIAGIYYSNFVLIGGFLICLWLLLLLLGSLAWLGACSNGFRSCLCRGILLPSALKMYRVSKWVLNSEPYISLFFLDSYGKPNVFHQLAELVNPCSSSTQAFMEVVRFLLFSCFVSCLVLKRLNLSLNERSPAWFSHLPFFDNLQN